MEGVSITFAEWLGYEGFFFIFMMLIVVLPFFAGVLMEYYFGEPPHDGSRIDNPRGAMEAKTMFYQSMWLNQDE